MLFLLYINDIVNGVDSHIRRFADVYIVYRQIHIPADNLTLESNFYKLLYCVKPLPFIMCRFVIYCNEEHIGIYG